MESSDRREPISDPKHPANPGASFGEPMVNDTGTTSPGRGVEGSPDIAEGGGNSNFSGHGGEQANTPRSSGSEIDAGDFANSGRSAPRDESDQHGANDQEPMG